MPSYKEIVALNQPVKGVRVVPPGPPPPPAVPEPEVVEREQAAFKQGVQQGQQQMQQQLQQVRQQAQQQQNRVLTKLQDDFQNLMEEVNHRLPELVLTLVRRVLVHVDTQNEETVRALVQDALGELSKGGTDLTVRLSPDDLKLLAGDAQEDFANHYPGITFEADGNLSNGDVKVRSRFGIVDATLETKLKKVEEDLKGEA